MDSPFKGPVMDMINVIFVVNPKQAIEQNWFVGDLRRHDAPVTSRLW